MDLLGGDALSSAPPSHTPGGGAPDAKRIKTWLHTLLLNDGGVLYEDDCLQAKVEMQVQGPMAKVQIRYQNKGGAPLEMLRVLIAPVPFLQIQDQGVPQNLGPHAAHPQMIQLKVTDYFMDAPRLQISYSVGGKATSAETKLPLSICKFLTPVQCTKEQFFGVWNKINGAPCEVSQVLKGTNPFSGPELEACMKGIHLTVLPGIDPNPANFCGAAKTNIGQGDVFVVVRIETQASTNAYKFTIKTSNGTVTAVLRQILADHINPP